MRLFLFFLCFIICSLKSTEFIFVPDHGPSAKTLFSKGEVSDYKSASLWDKIKFLLNQHGHDVIGKTLKELDLKKVTKSTQLVLWNGPRNFEKSKLKDLKPRQLALIVFEPPSVASWIHKDSYYAHFSKVLTWEDEKIDGDKFRKYYHPVCYPMIQDVVPFDKRKLCIVMSANKTSKYIHELYTERKEAIKYFDQFPDQFDLYGPAWGKEGFVTYKGVVESKIETLKNYKFSICYENTQGVRGYITEKIFDCFQAGVVPVYLGAPNIGDEIPEDCFIDRRKFGSYNELHKYLLSMKQEEFESYLTKIECFLKSKNAVKYTIDGFAVAIVNGLIGLNLTLNDLPE